MPATGPIIRARERRPPAAAPHHMVGKKRQQPGRLSGIGDDEQQPHGQHAGIGETGKSLRRRQHPRYQQHPQRREDNDIRRQKLQTQGDQHQADDD